MTGHVGEALRGRGQVDAVGVGDEGWHAGVRGWSAGGWACTRWVGDGEGG